MVVATQGTQTAAAAAEEEEPVATTTPTVKNESTQHPPSTTTTSGASSADSPATTTMDDEDAPSDDEETNWGIPNWGTSQMRDIIGDFLRTFSDSNANRREETEEEEEVTTLPHAKKQAVDTECGSFELLDRYDCCVSEEELESFQDAEGRFANADHLMQRVFEGGCRPEVRPTAYPFLLGYLPMDRTAAERDALRRTKREEYDEVLKLSVSSDQERRELSVQIDKDVIRTDASHAFFKGKMKNANVLKMRRILLAYAFYNYDLGYCQGMSDLLAPLLYTIQDEADCFWCFVGLMSRTERSFDRDQTGMHKQLLALRRLVQLLDPQLHAHFGKQDCRNYLFCYRWLLLHFKREFDFTDCLRLWEALWTCRFCSHLLLYVCVAVLQQFRAEIIDNSMTFDDMVLFTNDLVKRIPLEESLRNAELLSKFAGRKGKAILRLLL